MRDSLLDDYLKGQEIPKGAHSVASSLKEIGIDSKVVITDSFLKNVNAEDYYQRLQDLVINKINQFKPKNIGINLMYTFTEPSVLEMVKIIKENHPDIKIIVGGNYATFDADRLLDPNNNFGIDFVVRREGEQTTKELLQELQKNQPDLTKIKGISYLDKQNDTIQINPPRERMRPDQLPPIDYSLLDMSAEDKLTNFNHYVLFSRGCTGNCAFCTSPNMWEHEITNIAADNFKKEIEHLLKNGVREIALLDDDILVKEPNFNQVTKILKNIQENKKDLEIDPNSEISFIVQSKVNHFKERDKAKDYVNKMIEAGINKVYLGIESGSQVILDAMQKGVKVENIPIALKNIREFAKNKIQIGAFWIIGHPGATNEEEEKSLAFLKELISNNLIDELEAHIFVPYTGTKAIKDERMKIDENPNLSDYGFLNNEPIYKLIDPDTKEIIMTREKIKEFLALTLEAWKNHLENKKTKLE